MMKKMTERIKPSYNIDRVINPSVPTVSYERKTQNLNFYLNTLHLQNPDLSFIALNEFPYLHGYPGIPDFYILPVHF